MKEGNVLFNDALNTFSIRLYDVGHLVQDHPDSERGIPLPPHRLLFPTSTYHELCYTSRGALDGSKIVKKSHECCCTRLQKQSESSSERKYYYYYYYLTTHSTYFIYGYMASNVW